MGGKKHNPEMQRAIINEMIQLGLSTQEAARRYGTTAASIQRWKRKLAIAARTVGGAARSTSGGAVNMAILTAEIREIVHALLPAALHAEIVHLARAISRLPPPRQRRKSGRRLRR